MAEGTYEEQRAAIVAESKKQKRKILWLTVGGFALVIAAFIVVCIFWLNLIGFSVAALLILLGTIAKLGGEAFSNAKKMEQHRLQLLDENVAGTRFKL